MGIFVVVFVMSNKESNYIKLYFSETKKIVLHFELCVCVCVCFK